MPRTRPFETHPDRYESWFDRHWLAYQSELMAVRMLVPSPGEGIEIGAGTGRFAAPLGVRFGIEPALPMARTAKDNGIDVLCGVGEKLPLRNERFDYVLLVTTLCFLDDPERALLEIRRILRPPGRVVLGFVDKDSALGKRYFENKAESLFYREAEFYSVQDVLTLLDQTGFGSIATAQTLFSPLGEITRIETARSGYGEGSFVVVRAEKIP
ncbi:MAG TPA: class I SAM-dependent methyltransferase [bacterium]|nr:class I SAM-dependent methyltransferase [bacterium]